MGEAVAAWAAPLVFGGNCARAVSLKILYQLSVEETCLSALQFLIVLPVHERSRCILSV